MTNLLVNEKEIVIPGEALAEGLDYLPGEHTYRENEKIYAKVLGLVYLSGRVLKITPLVGPYALKVGDRIIGRVIDITMSGWRIETGTPYSAMLNVRDASTRFIKRDENLSNILAIGDNVIVKITNVTSQKLVDVSMREPDLHKIKGGRIFKINCTKVPRVIGKQGSMISLLKEKTGCSIVVGQNGFIWIKGSPEGELLAKKAIEMIEERSHEEGLTQKVEKFLGGAQ